MGMFDYDEHHEWTQQTQKADEDVLDSWILMSYEECSYRWNSYTAETFTWDMYILAHNFVPLACVCTHVYHMYTIPFNHLNLVTYCLGPFSTVHA